MGAAIETLLDADALSGDFVSMAAGMGPEVWAAVAQVYAATLEAQGGAGTYPRDFTPE